MRNLKRDLAGILVAFLQGYLNSTPLASKKLLVTSCKDARMQDSFTVEP